MGSTVEENFRLPYKSTNTNTVHLVQTIELLGREISIGGDDPDGIVREDRRVDGGQETRVPQKDGEGSKVRTATRTGGSGRK